MRPPRRLLPLIGDRDATHRRALACVAHLPPDDVLWVGDDDEPAAIPPGRVRRLLGRSAAAVVLDGHDGLNADLLAACPGFLHAGGTFVLRLAPTQVVPPHLGVHPSRVVTRPATTRFEARLRAALASAPLAPEAPVPPCAPAREGTPQQAALVEALTHALRGPPSVHALVAPRGRGKSTALGQVLARARGLGLQVALCAPDPQAADVARRAAGDLQVLAPEEALTHATAAGWDVLAVDEAAQLPVPWLQAIARDHPRHLLFATTTGGYEGTGQGFVLRFLASLDADPRPLVRHALDEPIRWAPGDPLEAWLDRLLLDTVAPSRPQGVAPERTYEAVDPKELAREDRLLEQVFGLLQHAHYRTTPADLQRLLDAPNLTLHVAREGADIVATNWVAVEGGLTPDEGEAMRAGQLRVRGHALPDTLVSHSGAVDAASWRWIRSVRLAVHPDRRGRGIASELAEHVHRHHLDPARAHGPVDGFGTLFGAVAHVVRLRHRLGYRLVRLGASRGSRTGEPSAVMVRPVSPRAEALVATLGGRAARDLDLWLALLEGDGQLPLAPELASALREHLPAPAPLTPPEVAEAVQAYVHGPRPLEAAASALRAWLPTTDRTGWTAMEHGLVADRLEAFRSWSTTAERAGLPHPRAAMRALKRACRRLALPPSSS